MDAREIVLEDVDALISELETQYENDRLMPELMPHSVVTSTSHCTAIICTGSCPCIDEA